MPTPEQIEALRARRTLAETRIQKLLAIPETDRTKADAREIRGEQIMIGQLDKVLRQVDPPPPASSPGVEPDNDLGVVLARIPKTKRSELRVSVKEWRGRRTVDVRLWYIPKGGDGGWAPSRKGVSIDASKLDALLSGLHSARQHAPMGEG